MASGPTNCGFRAHYIPQFDDRLDHAFSPSVCFIAGSWRKRTMSTGSSLTGAAVASFLIVLNPSSLKPGIFRGYSQQSSTKLVHQAMFEANAVQVRVSIDEIEPDVWRRLILPVHWNLEQLHLGIQAAFNWWNYHLYEFRIGGLRYGDVEILTEDATDDDPRVFDQREVRLLDFEQGSVFSYHYDFGDGWRHTVTVEEFLTLATSPRTGTCVDGKRARPPEDVGGVSGYERFLEIITDREDPEYAETIRWCGGHFDPEWFDLPKTDKDVRNALRANVKRRLYQPKPKAIPKK